MALPTNPVAGQVYRFGTYTLDGNPIAKPSRPWSPGYKNAAIHNNQYGDTPQGNASSILALVDTVAGKESESVYLGKFLNGHDTYLDTYNCACGIPWDRLNALGFIDGKEVTVDGVRMRIRVLDGGDNSKGGSAPKNDNEWDDIFGGLAQIAGMPQPTSGELANNYTDGPVNQLLNYLDIYSWTKRVQYNYASNRVLRGCNGARYYSNNTSSYPVNTYGVRLVREILISAPLISDDQGDNTDLGAPNGAFDHSFHVADGGGGNFSVTATLDGTESLLSLTDQTTGDFTASITADQWAALAYGDHTLAITATDGDSRTATRTLTFKRTFAAPEITGLTTGRRILESGEIEFTDSAEPNGPAITYEVEMATDAGFTAGLLTFPGTAGETKASYSGLVTKTEYYARAVGISGTERRPGAAIKVKAGKTGTITLAPLEPQPNSRPDHGQPYLRGIVPAGASVTVEVCNNGNDASPAWEDATATALAGGGAMHVFANQAKTAPTWAYGLRVLQDAGTSTEPIKITEIGR